MGIKNNFTISSLDEQEDGGIINRSKQVKGRSCLEGRHGTSSNGHVGFAVPVGRKSSVLASSSKWKLSVQSGSH